jgi:hypothetical protein
MFNVKISVPTYQASSWGQLDKQGEVQISADVDSLSQEYPVMKAQIDELLKEASAENRLSLLTVRMMMTILTNFNYEC